MRPHRHRGLEEYGDRGIHGNMDRGMQGEFRLGAELFHFHNWTLEFVLFLQFLTCVSYSPRPIIVFPAPKIVARALLSDTRPLFFQFFVKNAHFFVTFRFQNRSISYTWRPIVIFLDWPPIRKPKPSLIPRMTM